MKIKRCLISVSDKEGIVDFAKELVSLNIEIIASKKTKELLKTSGINVLSIDEVTGFPEILEGRVKTLHPIIYGGILAKREKAHLDELLKHNIKPIDMVVCNLYPFEERLKNNITKDEAIEEIDIGGVSLIRAAAKNHKYVATIVDKGQYKELIAMLKERGEIQDELLYRLAVYAFGYIARYDIAISNWFSKDRFPDNLNISLKKAIKLKYGENPHQSASFYVKDEPQFTQISGDSLSYNNILDLSSAWRLAWEFKEPCCVIIKHNSPCGVALSSDVYNAYRSAYEADPISAFGGIIGMNTSLDIKTAIAISKTFYEGIIVPSFDNEVKALFKNKKIRLILGKIREDEIELRSCLSGVLIQEEDIENYKDLSFPTKKRPSWDELEDLLFGYKVCKYVRSNAIVVTMDKKTLGMCGGQPNRVDAVRIAIERAGNKTNGACLASDGFFPFTDSVELAAKAHISAVIQPGGSIKDKDVIEKADELGISMVFAHMRHFRH